MLASAVAAGEQAHEQARDMAPTVRRVLRKASTRTALQQAVGRRRNAASLVDAVTSYSPMDGHADLDDSLKRALDHADQVSLQVVRQSVGAMLLFADACPVKAPLAWGPDVLGRELRTMVRALDRQEESLRKALASGRSAERQAKTWARTGRQAWIELAPYARALDRWGEARGSKRRLIPQQVELSLRVAEAAQAALRAYAAGTLCSIAVTADGPLADQWRQAAAAGTVDTIPGKSVERIEDADSAFTASVNGDNVRITGVVNSTRAIQVTQQKRVHVLGLSSPTGPRTIVILPFFNPLPLGIEVGTVLQVGGVYLEDVLDEYVNTNTRRTLRDVETVFGSRRGLRVNRFSLEDVEKAQPWTGWVANHIRPALDVAPSALSAVWSLQPGLSHVVARRTWSTELPENWRRNARIPDGG